MTGESALIAEVEEGKLQSHPEAFEELGARAIARALDSPEVELIVMDELGLLEGEAPRFQAAALTETTLYAIDKWKLLKLIRHEPQLADRLSQLLGYKKNLILFYQR